MPSLPPPELSAKPRRSSMTHWSRHDPVMLPHGNSDHWTKMKVKATTFEVTKDANGTVKYLRPRDDRVDLRELRKRQRADNKPEDRLMKLMNPHLASASGPLRGSGSGFEVPGNYHMNRPNTSQRRVCVDNTFHERAKEGFKYWYQERPKPTGFGKYGIGSYKTVLGIGNAPRT